MGLGNFPIVTSQPETVLVLGSFDVNGASSPVAAAGDGFTVARTGVGTYVVTFDRKYSQAIHMGAQLQMDAAEPDSEAQVGPYTAPTSTTKGTLTIYVGNKSVNAAGAGTEQTAITLEDLAAASNRRVHFSALFQRIVKLQ